ncbi:ferredoxin [Streptomyces pacificus]|uniref:Ferredoxin n=1 Tax=Streptomyces pacificus TaxID=2705029 RepID=A0A6A0B4M7_9ACTN|nr:ferredoxin [Streptomyces pacificus]GFH39481.1 ferredoxin [Streptomyces pacificus]
MTRISVDTGKCIGAAQCVLTAPTVFDQNDDGFVELLQQAPDGAESRSARMAASVCPAQAITVRE